VVAVCPKCGEEFHFGERVGAKVGGAALGALVGGSASRHWLGAFIGAVLGGAVGHVVDEEFIPSCPTCRIALEVLDAVL
jgi:outer membrane lipoprotein SlyB